MKSTKYIWILFLSLGFLLSSCDFSEDAGDRSFNQNLQSFNNSINKVDSAIVLIDQMQNELNQIDEQQELGKMEDIEAKTEKDKIRSDFGRRIAQNSNLKPVTGLPGWALRLGLTEPHGMKLDMTFSQATSETNPNEGYNSVILVYRGTYDQAMKQAQLIAAQASIPMSKDFEDAQKLAREYDIATLKGMAYMNFEIGSANLPHYSIAITVDEDGILTISATDTDKFNEQLNETE